ncbi:mucin-5AC-like [Polyodon spathula]|uniref:mucin-5AC-like n=1 Tax=Polyodon spathula TaxID=7913 RepID=UPI001B7F7927|nr:mucin-5AC-like [Polyodon spathula]
MQLYIRMVLFFVNTGYLHSLIHHDCGGVIDASKENTGVFQHSISANNTNTMHGISCTWVIEALSTETVHLTLLSMDNKTCISVYFENSQKVSICGSRNETLLSGKGRGVITWRAAAGSSANETQIRYRVVVNWCARLSPCLNGGTCIPGESSATCVCLKTWQGKHCERETRNLLEERLPHTESLGRKAPLSQETSFHGIPEITIILQSTRIRRKPWLTTPGDSAPTTFSDKGTARYDTTEGQPRDENNTTKAFPSNSSVSSYWPRDSESTAVGADKERLPSSQETSHNNKDSALLTDQALSHIVRFTATDDPSLGLTSLATEETQKTKPALFRIERKPLIARYTAMEKHPTGVTAVLFPSTRQEERLHAPDNGPSSQRNVSHLYTLVSATFPVSPSQESASQTFTVKPSFPLATSFSDTTAPPDSVHNPTESLPPQHDQEMESNDRDYHHGTKLKASLEMKAVSLSTIIPEMNTPTKTEPSQTLNDLSNSGSSTGSQALFAGHNAGRKITALSSTATLNYNLTSMLSSSATDPDTPETALKLPKVSHLLTTPLEFSSEATLDPAGFTHSAFDHQRNSDSDIRYSTEVTENNSLSLQTVNELSETPKYAAEIAKEINDFFHEGSENTTRQITAVTSTPLMEDFNVSLFEDKLVPMVTRSLPEGDIYNFMSKGETASESEVGVSISKQGFSERALSSSTSEEDVSTLTTLIESSRKVGLENSTLYTDSAPPHIGTTESDVMLHFTRVTPSTTTSSPEIFPQSESTASTSELPTFALHSSPKLLIWTAEPSTLSITTHKQITVSQNTRRSASPTETFEEMSMSNDVISSEDGIKSTSASATLTEMGWTSKKEPRTSSENFDSSYLPFITLTDTARHYKSTAVGLDPAVESPTLYTSLPQEETAVPDSASSFFTPLLTSSFDVAVTSLNTGGATGPTLQTTTSLNAVVLQTLSPRGEGSSPTPVRQTEMETEVLSTGYSSTTVPQTTLPPAMDDSSLNLTTLSPGAQSTPVSKINSTAGSGNVTESTTVLTSVESSTTEQLSTAPGVTNAKGKKNSTPGLSKDLPVDQSSTFTYNGTFARHTGSATVKTRPTAISNKSESTPVPFPGRVNVTLTTRPLATSTIRTTTLRAPATLTEVPAFGKGVFTTTSYGQKTAGSSPGPPVMFSTSKNTYEKTERIFIVENQPPIIKEKNIKVPSLLVLEMEFSKDLANPKSRTFENLVEDFQGKVDPFYKNIPGYQHLQISGISSGSVLIEYDAVFSTESVLGWVEDLAGLLNMTGLPEAISQGFYIGGARVLRISVRKRQADLCSSVFHCQLGFDCVPAGRRNASCTSLCHRDYCKNSGICTHQRGQQPVCQCPVGVDYWFMGLRCDHKMSQQKLIGIAFGVLLAVAVMMAAIAFLVMRRFKALLIQAKVDQTRSSYRRFSRFDDISEQFWSQSWLDSANSLDNPAFTHSDELTHLRRLDSSYCSCLEESLTTSNSSKRNMPHVRTVFRHSSQYNWDLSDSSINDHMADSGKASDLSVSSWPMEPIQWTPFPILQQLGIERPFKTRRPRSFCEGMELVNLERTWTA